MPNKPLHPCRHPGCHVLTREAYCPAHKPAPIDRSEESKAWRWMYNTPEWKEDLRPYQLMVEPFCRECAKHGLRVRATDVDHIKDHKGNWQLFTDRRNLESLCHSCHSRKTYEEMRKNAPKKRR